MAAHHGHVWNTWPTYMTFAKRFVADFQKYGAKAMFDKYLKFSCVRVGGNLIGTDAMGNQYFENHEYKLEPLQRRYRWVEFAAKDWDATHVPPEWHGWLAYTHDIVPGSPEAQALYPKYRKDPIPNQTGSNTAYFPPNAVGTLTHVNFVSTVQAFDPSNPKADDTRVQYDHEYDNPNHPASL